MTINNNNTVYNKKKDMALFCIIKRDRKYENPTSKPGYIFALLVSGESRVKPAVALLNADVNLLGLRLEIMRI
jgi:hypothetical protein